MAPWPDATDSGNTPQSALPTYLVYFTKKVEEDKKLQQNRDYVGCQPGEKEEIFFLEKWKVFPEDFR